MAYDQKPNCGTMFKNEDKRSHNSPDYSGPINIEGVNYFISGWIKTAGPTARNPGSKFLSVSVQLSTKNANPAPPGSATGAKFDGNAGDDYDDDIPFRYGVA